MEKSESPNENKKLMWSIQLTDALFIAILTSLGYFLTRSYFASYHDYYHIPSIYIEITAPKILDVLNSFLSLFGLYKSYLILLLLIPVSYSKFKENFIVKAIIRYIIMLFLFALPTFYIMKCTTLSITLYLTMFLLLTYYIFIKPIFQKDKSSYLYKLQNSIEEGSLTKLNLLIDYFKTRLGIYCLLIFLIILLLPVAEYLGNQKAEEQSNYLVLRGSEDMVVLDTYKDLLIIAPISLKDKSISPKFQLIEQKSELKKPVKFQLLHLGKVKVKPPVTLINNK